MAKVLVKSKLWPELKYHPHAGQKRIHASTTRHRVNAAGRRFGKSQTGGHELTVEAFRAKLNKPLLEDLGIRMEFWIVGPNYTDSEKEFRVLYNDLKRLKVPFDRPGTYNDTRSGNMQVSLWEGRYIVTAKSAAHPESLVGEGLHGVVMAEAAKMKESVWVKYVRPTLSDFGGWSLWNSTPEGKNYFHRLYQQGQDKDVEDWESWKHPSWVNHFVYPKGKADPEIAALRQDLGDVLFAQEIECSFTEFAGRVYYDFDEDTHVTDLEYNPSWPLFIATDYGYTNPNVALFIQTDPFDNVYVIAEYYRTHRTEDEFAQDVAEDSILGPLSRAATVLYPDPEDPGATRTLANKWKVRAVGGTGGELKNRINAIRRFLKVQNTHLALDDPLRTPRLKFDRSCVNAIREMDAYRYPDVKDGRPGNRPPQENPLKKDDHAPEALSRFFAAKYPIITKGKTRVKKARIG